MSEWIPVSERLPVKHNWYRVYIKTRMREYQTDAIFSAYHGGWNDMGGIKLDGVTHWMPLPEPPESSDE